MHTVMRAVIAATTQFLEQTLRRSPLPPREPALFSRISVNIDPLASFGAGCRAHTAQTSCGSIDLAHRRPRHTQHTISLIGRRCSKYARRTLPIRSTTIPQYRPLRTMRKDADYSIRGVGFETRNPPSGGPVTEFTFAVRRQQRPEQSVRLSLDPYQTSTLRCVHDGAGLWPTRLTLLHGVMPNMHRIDTGNAEA